MLILSVWINRESGASETVYSEKENSGAVPAAVNLYKSFLKQAATVGNNNDGKASKSKVSQKTCQMKIIFSS